MPYATCPGCDEKIYLRTTPKIGDIVYCPTCETELEVVGLNPIELDWPWEDEEEDDEWYDEEDEEDEEDLDE